MDSSRHSALLVTKRRPTNKTENILRVNLVSFSSKTGSDIWGPIFEGVFSTQTYSGLGHIALSVPMLGAGRLGNEQTTMQKTA